MNVDINNYVFLNSWGFKMIVNQKNKVMKETNITHWHSSKKWIGEKYAIKSIIKTYGWLSPATEQLQSQQREQQDTEEEEDEDIHYLRHCTTDVPECSPNL